MTMQDETTSVVAASATLIGHLVGFRQELTRIGYGPVRSGAHLELFADLCGWLEREGLSPTVLTSDRVSAFLDYRRSCGHSDLVALNGVAPLLGYLVRIGAVPKQRFVVPEGPGRGLLERYWHYLEVERGLAPRTIEYYVKLTSRFMASLERDGTIDWQRVRARDVTSFLCVCVSAPPQRAVHTPHVVPVLRSFLRFALIEGVIDLPLHNAVPPVAGWRMGPLPRGVAPEMLRRLLESCDRSSAKGRRDFAIMTLLSRLGLRAGEVTAMVLDDLDWRAGTLVVHGKARRDERVPLPVDVGEAIVDYLHDGRAQAESRAVFLRCYAPQRALSLPAVSGIVYAACERAGIARVSAHQLRHSAASAMLAGGASLAEVGEALRQRSAASTAIYAKVDRVRLNALAREWPGGAV